MFGVFVTFSDIPVLVQSGKSHTLRKALFTFFILAMIGLYNCDHILS